MSFMHFCQNVLQIYPVAWVQSVLFFVVRLAISQAGIIATRTLTLMQGSEEK